MPSDRITDLVDAFINDRLNAADKDLMEVMLAEPTFREQLTQMALLTDGLHKLEYLKMKAMLMEWGDSGKDTE